MWKQIQNTLLLSPDSSDGGDSFEITGDTSTSSAPTETVPTAVKPSQLQTPAEKQLSRIPEETLKQEIDFTDVLPDVDSISGDRKMANKLDEFHQKRMELSKEKQKEKKALDKKVTEVPIKEKGAEEEETTEEKASEDSDTKEFEVPSLEEKKEEKKEVQTKKAFPKDRDLSKLPEEVRPFAKNMSNEAFAFFEKRLPELYALKAREEKIVAKEQELAKNGIPQQWYEHEEAFKLTPTYKQCEGLYETKSQEYAFWEKQLLQVEEGNDFEYLVQDAQGNYSVSPTKLKATPKNKLELQKKLQSVQGELINIENFAKTEAQVFKAQHSGARDGILKVIEERFPWVNQPERSPSMTANYKNAEKLVPPAYKDHPLAKLSCALWAYGMEIHAKHTEMMKKLGGNASKTSTLEKTDPPSRGGSASEEPGYKPKKKDAKYIPPPVFDLSDMPKV